MVTMNNKHNQKQQHQPQQRRKVAARRVCIFGTSANPPTGDWGHGGIVRALAEMEHKEDENNANAGLLHNYQQYYESIATPAFDEIRVVPVYNAHPCSVSLMIYCRFE